MWERWKFKNFSKRERRIGRSEKIINLRNRIIKLEYLKLCRRRNLKIRMGILSLKWKSIIIILLLGCFKLRNRNIINKIRLKRFEIKLDFLTIIKFRVLIRR